ncbi:hypothetical protein ABE59_12385 [Bacillus safensis]|nr:hypothetical protein [Bacillus safensis]
MKGKTKFLLKFEDFAYHFLKNVTIRAKIAVALYMSAWIEIRKKERPLTKYPGRTLYECVD